MRENKKGFTLVEVIVVLVILAILIALLAPSLTGYIDKGKYVAADANARQVFVAAQAAMAEMHAAGDNPITPGSSNRRFYAYYYEGVGWGAATSGGTLNKYTGRIVDYLADDVQGFFAVFVGEDGKPQGVIWQETNRETPENSGKADDIVGVYPADFVPPSNVVTNRD